MLKHIKECLPQALIGLRMYTFDRLTPEDEIVFYNTYKENEYLSLLIRRFSKSLSPLSQSETERFIHLDKAICTSNNTDDSSLLSMAYALSGQEKKYKQRIDELILDEDFPTEAKTCLLEHLNNQQRLQDLDMKDVLSFFKYLETMVET